MTEQNNYNQRVALNGTCCCNGYLHSNIIDLSIKEIQQFLHAVESLADITNTDGYISFYKDSATNVYICNLYNRLKPMISWMREHPDPTEIKQAAPTRFSLTRCHRRR